VARDARRHVRNPNSRLNQHHLRLPKKLRKRKWKIGAIKNFVNQHILGYEMTIEEEVTSSRAAEKYSSKSPSTKEHRKSHHNDEDDDEKEDETEDDQEKEEHDMQTGKPWRKSQKSPKDKTKDKRERNGKDERYNERNNKRFDERMNKHFIEYEPSAVMKLIWGLEQFSLSASDLNVVIFFFLLPWLRQLWR